MSVYSKLALIQNALKAPKSQYNKFGGYNYRNCEDILEAAKPLCMENDSALIVGDDVVMVGDRFYIKATATLVDLEDGSSVSVSAFAREDLAKKGMDASQVTGSASSYARKYALNGLFCIDDTKDDDTSESEEERKARIKKEEEAAKGNKTPDAVPDVIADVQKQLGGTVKKVAVVKDGNAVKVLNNAGVYVPVYQNSTAQLREMLNNADYAEAHEEVKELLRKRG